MIVYKYYLLLCKRMFFHTLSLSVKGFILQWAKSDILNMEVQLHVLNHKHIWSADPKKSSRKSYQFLFSSVLQPGSPVCPFTK